MSIELIDSTNPYSAQNALNIYTYGSRVYGTCTEKSDIDFIMVSDIPEYEVQFNTGKVSCTILSIDEFIKRAKENDISILECLFLPSNFIIKEKYRPRGIEGFDLPALRKSISSKASNSFVKAKKKFIVDKDRDIYVGKKSLFHSLRIIDFGIQLAVDQKIYNYSSANKYWYDIINDESEAWEHYKNKYKPVFNGLLTKFRKYAPKVY